MWPMDESQIKQLEARLQTQCPVHRHTCIFADPQHRQYTQPKYEYGVVDQEPAKKLETYLRSLQKRRGKDKTQEA